MAVQIGTDPGTGEPIYAPVDPGTIPGFDIYGHAIPGFPSSGTGINYDTVINGVPFINGQPAVSVPAEYLNPTYSPYPVSAKQPEVPSPNPPKQYKPGSTMYELGFNDESEYTGAAARKGRGPNYADRQKEAAKATKTIQTKGVAPSKSKSTTQPPANKNLIVVGVSPDTNELIVKDSVTKEIFYKPGTAAQVKEATAALSKGEDTVYNKPYEPPEGVDYNKPIPGALAAPSTDKEVKIYDYRGKVISIDPETITELAGASGKRQFDLSVQAGLIPGNAEYKSEGDNWSFTIPVKEQQTVQNTLRVVNKSGEEEFNRLVSNGTIKKGSVYAGVSPDGTIQTYPPDTVVKVGNNEFMAKEDYAQLPREWKKIIDTKGTTGLSKLANEGDLPVFVDEWWYKGKVISGEEKEKLLQDWRGKRESLNILSDEYTRLGNNPELEITRAVSPDDMARSVSTFNQNTRTKLRNSTEIWNTMAAESPNTPEGQVARFMLEKLNWSVRAAGSAGLVLAEAGTVSAPIAITQALANPTKIPGMAQGMVVNTVDSFKTVGRVLIGDTSVTPEAAGAAGASVYLTFRAVKGVVFKVATYLHPKGIPAELIGKEYSTGRVPVNDIDPVAMTKAMNQVEKLATAKGGAASGDIPIDGTPYSLHYLKTPYQRVVGDTVWHGTGDIGFVKEGTLVAKEVGTGGEPGLYTNPWAALEYAKGAKPGLLMIITKASNIKTTPAKVSATFPTQSDYFIEKASKGLYGSSKTWKGDLETEVVAAPGSEFIIPKANPDLITRFTVGKSSDFFTYANGQLIPIKIAVDKGLLQSGDIPYIPTATDLYAVKLHSLQNSLQNFTEAVKHPVRTLSDIVKQTPTPGVREVSIVTADGKDISGIAQTLTNEAYGEALRSARSQGISTRGAAFQTLFNRELDNAYSARAEALIEQYKGEASAYERADERVKFEEIYRVNLEDAMRSLVESTAIREDTAREVTTRDGERPTERTDTTRATDRAPVVRETAPPTEREPVRGAAERKPPVERVTPPRERPPEVVRPPDVRPPDNIRPPDKVRPPEVVRPPDKIRPPEEVKPPEKTYQPGKKRGDEVAPEPPEVLPENKGAVAWKQGAIFGKPVINVLRKPFKTSEDLKTTVGQVPAGVTLLRGKGSAQKSAVLLTKPGPKDVTIDSGFQDLNIQSQGNRVVLTYKPDPHGLTIHAIRVGNPKPPHSRQPRKSVVPNSPSRRVGKQYYTPMGSTTAISRRPLGKRSKQR